MDSLGDLNTKFSTTERCKKVVGLVRFQVSLRLVQYVVSPHRKFRNLCHCRILCKFLDMGLLSGENRLWAQVVNDMWATRVITLSTAILRLCRAAQMLLCCYMLASMALEYDQICEQDKEMMTVFQRGNEGPISMCWMFSKHDITRSRTPRGSSPLP